MKTTATLLSLFATAWLATAARADNLLTYAEPDGKIKTVAVERLQKDTEADFVARIRVAGRLRSLRIPARQVVSYLRGSSSDINQWSKSLAKGRRLMAAGRIATEGTVPGAEEMFVKCTYSMEKGTRGQEATEQIRPWHNKYALFHLIEARYRLGKEKGDKEKLTAALADIDQFNKRAGSKRGRKIDWEVPGAEGTVSTQKVYCWGDTRLTPLVMLYKARILAAQGVKDGAMEAYDAVLTHLQKNKGSPVLMTISVIEKAETAAAGLESEQAEQAFASAGNKLSAMAGSQTDVFGQATLRTAANQALLRGADLLLESAHNGKLSFDQPLQRYLGLKAGKGSQDPAVYMGAQAGVGICLTEKGNGRQGYEALLEVVVRGYEYPEQMARALFYLGKAAPLYAKEVEASGGEGGFLRDEAARWLQDLKDRYPSSEWASKASAK